MYLFAAPDVQNVVIIATKNEERLSRLELGLRAQDLTNERPRAFPPGFMMGISKFYDTAPSGLAGALILTDDFAPTDNLLR
jgi:hypothetical protein